MRSCRSVRLAVLCVAVAAHPALAQVTETVLTGPGTDARPAWSPDGSTILFDSFRSGNPDVWSIPAAGGTPTRLTLSKNVDQAPDWAPDGTAYTFSAVQGGGAPDIFRRPISGGAATLVYADPATNDGLPAWSPDGSQIAFVKGADVYVVPSTGGTAVQITTSPANDTHPTWSPDGTQIAYQSDAGGNVDVWVIPATGGTPVRLTSHPSTEGAPDWSPDGTQIAYQSQQGGNNDIWIMPASGGPGAQVTTDPASDQHPDWSPTGTSIVFSRSGGLVIATLATGSAADLGVTKTVDAASPPLGGTVVYTVTVTNHGPDAVNVVEVTDALPFGVMYASDLPSQGTYSSATGIWTVGSLAAGTFATLDLAADVTAPSGTIVNQAAVTAADLIDPNGTNNFASVTVTVAGGVAFTPLLTGGISDQRPVFSPDGSTVFFDSNRSGNRDLWYVASTGGVPTRFTFNGAFDGHPDYAPDGTVLAFSAVLGAGSDLYVRSLVSGPASSLLIDPSSADRYPEYSPDGSLVAFDKGGDVYVMPAAGGTAIPIVTDPANDGHPSWSPDGSMIAFNSDRTGNTDIWVVPATGGTEVQMTATPALDGSADWSPDGQWIAFHSDRDGQAGIWIMPSVGGQAIKLSDGAGADTQPGWNADGTKIVFSRNSNIWFMTGFEPLLSRAIATRTEQPVDIASSRQPVTSGAPTVDLEVLASVDHVQPAEGDEVRYAFAVTNLAARQATRVEIESVLPEGLTFTSAVASAGSYDATRGVWSLPELAAGASAGLEVRASVDFGTAGQTLASAATLSTADQRDTDVTNDSDWVRIVVVEAHAAGPGLSATTTPATLSLAVGRPNPFRETTTFQFELPRAGMADLAVYDVTGRRVMTLLSGPLEAGRFAVTWDGRDEAGTRTAPGVYFVRLEAQGVGTTRKSIRLE